MANKQGSFKLMGIVMAVSLFIAFLWDKVPAIKNSIHAILNPTFGALMAWDLTIGMLIIVFIISIFTVIIQKYATDQVALKALKKEQKDLQEEMKKHKDNPAKLKELQKQQFAFFPKTMKLTTNAMVYTSVPLILFFRWFSDYFLTAGNPKFFGIFGWFVFYLLATIIFSSIMKKYFDIA